MHRGIEIAVQAEDVKRLVVFVLVDALGRNLNDRVDYFRATLSDRQFQIIDHNGSAAAFMITQAEMVAKRFRSERKLGEVQAELDRLGPQQRHNSILVPGEHLPASYGRV
jgi:hypothetical protein